MPYGMVVIQHCLQACFVDPVNIIYKFYSKFAV